MSDTILEALRRRYEAEIAAAVANINVYRTNPVGIGEHPDLVSAVDDQVSKLSNAVDKLTVLNQTIFDLEKGTIKPSGDN